MIVAKPGQHIHARDDWQGCPEQNKCIQKGYLVNGDKVLITPQTEGWVCTYYLGKKSDYTGWIRQNYIKLITFSKHLARTRWIGTWKSLGGPYADSITIKLESHHSLRVHGRAYWYGGKNSYGDNIVHIGGVKGTGQPAGNRLTIKEGNDEYSCRVNLELFNSYLVVKDNNNCGGVNVSFTGIYKQKP